MIISESKTQLRLIGEYVKGTYWEDMIFRSINIYSEIIEPIESSSIKGDSLKDISSKGEKIKLEKAQTLKIQSVDYRVI